MKPGGWKARTMPSWSFVFVAVLASACVMTQAVRVQVNITVGLQGMPLLGGCRDHYHNCHAICKSKYPYKASVCPVTCGPCGNTTRVGHVTAATRPTHVTTHVTKHVTTPMMTSRMTKPTPAVSHGACFDHYRNCSIICASNYPSKDKICPVTCGPCSPKPPNHRRCYQCGNNGKPCTLAELFTGQDNQCTGSDVFCMTSINAHPDGSHEMWKQCVDEQACRTKWYAQTSDTDDCLDMSNLWPLIDVTCHFCCRGDNCNSDMVPAPSTLYTTR